MYLGCSLVNVYPEISECTLDIIQHEAETKNYLAAADYLYSQFGYKLMLIQSLAIINSSTFQEQKSLNSSNMNKVLALVILAFTLASLTEGKPQTPGT